jgi:hypothetical protein
MEREPRQSPHTGERAVAQVDLIAGTSPIAPPALGADRPSEHAAHGETAAIGEDEAGMHAGAASVPESSASSAVPSDQLTASMPGGPAPEPTGPRECPVCMTHPATEIFALTACCGQVICDRCVAQMLLSSVDGAAGRLLAGDYADAEDETEDEMAVAGVQPMHCPYCRAWMDPEVRARAASRARRWHPFVPPLPTSPSPPARCARASAGAHGLRGCRGAPAPPAGRLID